MLTIISMESAPNLQLWLYISDSNCTILDNPSNLIDIGVDLFTASSSKYFEGYMIESEIHQWTKLYRNPTKSFNYMEE